MHDRDAGSNHACPEIQDDSAFPGVTCLIFRTFVSDLVFERFSYYYTVSKFPSGLEYYDSKWAIRKIKKFEFY